jgi:RNA polymerase sigma-70 factor (ECF subfamily)
MKTRSAKRNGPAVPQPMHPKTPNSEADKAFEMPIIEMLRRGETAPAVETLSERYKNRITKIALRFLGNAEDAEDVAQDTFQKVMIKPLKFIPNRGCNISTILIISAMNDSRGILRRPYRKKEISIADVTENNQETERRYFFSREKSALHDLLSNETNEKLIAAISSLKPAQRDVIMMRYFEGLSHNEIMGATGVSIATVKSRLLKARKKLRMHIENSSKIHRKKQPPYDLFGR